MSTMRVRIERSPTKTGPGIRMSHSANAHARGWRWRGCGDAVGLHGWTRWLSWVTTKPLHDSANATTPRPLISLILTHLMRHRDYGRYKFRIIVRIDKNHNLTISCISFGTRRPFFCPPDQLPHHLTEGRIRCCTNENAHDIMHMQMYTLTRDFLGFVRVAYSSRHFLHPIMHFPPLIL
jgi:hypothetical protein